MMMVARAAPSIARARRRVAAGAAAVVAIVAGVAACAAPPRATDTVVYASGADLESGNPLVTLHPLARQVQRYVLFVTLARYDTALQPVPYAARRWVWSPDRRTLTLSLTRALRWQDGTPTTARDAAFTILAARDPATGFPRAGDLAAVSAADAPDDSTLVLRFSVAPPAFPAVLCELPIAPAHLLDTVPHAALRRSAFGFSPVGNGPFVFVSRVAKQRWVFERNDAFPAELGGPPAIRRFVVAVVDEPTTKFAGLVSGELDVAGISPPMAPLVARDASLRVIAYPLLFSTALVFNTSRPPFDDPAVRSAVNLSLDRERIIEVALAGYGVPAWGPVSPDNPLARATTATRDTARADALLDAAGWRRGAGRMRARDGRPLSVDLMTVGNGDNAVEQLIQGDLRARGIAVEIRVVELAAFLTRARATPKVYDLLLTGIPGDLSLSYLYGMYHSSMIGGALDYGSFHTQRLDALLDAVRTAPDDAAVRAAWDGVQAQLATDLPAAWVYHARGVQGISARLTGVRMDLRGELATLASWRIQPLAALGAFDGDATGRGPTVIARRPFSPDRR
jgi:peptide/nickel transport system substrate-binding protein